MRISCQQALDDRRRCAVARAGKNPRRMVEIRPNTCTIRVEVKVGVSSGSVRVSGTMSTATV